MRPTRRYFLRRSKISSKLSTAIGTVSTSSSIVVNGSITLTSFRLASATFLLPIRENAENLTEATGKKRDERAGFGAKHEHLAKFTKMSITDCGSTR
jgi:hypothetical protein